MTGVVQDVKRFKHKSYGFIKAEDGNIFYFNLGETIDSATLSEGAKVEFLVRGNKATNVKQIL